MTPVAKQPQISVMVLTRNRLATVRRCIASVLRQRTADFEIVLLDDASDTGDTAAQIAAELADARIRPFRAETSLGVAGGRNFLMEHAAGELLVSLDDDAIFVGDDELARLQTCFCAAEIGAVAFRIINVINDQRSELAPFTQAALAREPQLALRPARVASFRGGGHAIRKQVVAEVGGYRRDLFYGEEELDLAYRLVQAGHHIAYQPEIVVEHYPMPSVVATVGAGSRGAQELFYHVRNRAYLAYRYLPWRYACSYVAIWAARYAVRSVRERCVPSFVRGAIAAPKFLQGVDREVLGPQALAYLAKYGGRLWY